MPRLESLEDRTLLSTLTVLNTLDSGAGSLRYAIGHSRDGDTIVFDEKLSGGTITLTSGDLAIKNSLDIVGPGANLLAISGNDTSRVFDINAGLTVSFADLTITHGRSASGGGGI
ncbi:MAG: hemolysin, partial [Chloroflexota bacterium]